MKVIIIEQGKVPYFKDIDISEYNDNMNTFAEKEIGCEFIDRIQLLPNYELTIYVDDLNSRRDDSELNFFVKGVQYDLPVKGKAVVSRGEVYLDEIEYQDVTEQDMLTLHRMIQQVSNRPYADVDLGVKPHSLYEEAGEVPYYETNPAEYVYIESRFHHLLKKDKRRFIIGTEHTIWKLDDIIENLPKDKNPEIYADETGNPEALREWFRKVYEIAVDEWRLTYPGDEEFD